MPLTDSDITAVMNAGTTPRMRRLDEARGYFDGTVYDGRPDFFDDSNPLRERKPCVIYPIVRNAVQSYSALCLGDGKFPTITSGANEDDSVIDSRFGLSDSDSVVVDAGIRKILAQARIPAVAQQVFETELACGTSCTIASVVKGKLRVSQIEPRVCTPTFAPDDPDCVTSLEVTYRYVTDDTWSQAEGKFVRRVFVYRRVIDDQNDTTFAPVEITRATDNPTPNQPAANGVFKHGFGFCPVVWRRANVAISDQQGLDGRAIHWGLYSLIDTINLGLSQRFRAALYSGDPQLCEIGVRDDEVQMPIGRAADVRQPGADATGWQAPLQGRRTGGSSDARRKRGAGTVWRYESPDADVKILTLSGDALKTIADDIADNVKKLREALGHIYIDPDALSGFGDISGKTLAFIYAQQIARCNRLREEFGTSWILRIVNMLFRIVLACGKGLYLAGCSKLQPILKRFNAQVATTSATDNVAGPSQWFDPQLTLKWGDYFEASDIDESTRIDAALKAFNGKIITLQTAIEHIRGVFVINDVNQYMQTLLAETLQRQADALAQQQAMVGALCGPLDDGTAATGGNSLKASAISTTDSAAKPAKPPVAKTKQLALNK